MQIELNGIIKELLKEGAPYFERQDDLATDLGTDSPTISKIKYFKPEWEAHFQLFIKLVPIALRYDLLDPHFLLPKGDDHGSGRNLGNGKAGKASSGARK